MDTAPRPGRNPNPPWPRPEHVARCAELVGPAFPLTTRLPRDNAGRTPAIYPRLLFLRRVFDWPDFATNKSLKHEEAYICVCLQG